MADWLTGLDRERWSPRLITTQPSRQPRASARSSRAPLEVWDLPDLMPGGSMPEFILGLIESRGIGIVQIVDSRLGFDLLPDIACLERPPVIVARMPAPGVAETGYETYVARRYGNLIDAFSVADEGVKEALVAQFIPPSRIEVIAPGPGLGGGPRGALRATSRGAAGEQSLARRRALRVRRRSATGAPRRRADGAADPPAARPDARSAASGSSSPASATGSSSPSASSRSRRRRWPRPGSSSSTTAPMTRRRSRRWPCSTTTRRSRCCARSRTAARAPPATARSRCSTPITCCRSTPTTNCSPTRSS